VDLQGRQMNSKGFTLIEFIVVIAILMIITGTSVPRLEDLSRSYIAYQEKNRWLNLFAFARASAALENSIVTFCPLRANHCSEDMHQEWALFTDPNNNRIRDAGEQILRVLEPKAETRFGYYNLGKPYFRFGDIRGHNTYLGLASGFTLCPFGLLDKTAYHITINILGRAKLYSQRNDQQQPMRFTHSRWQVARCDR
jgi:prepilin-type N-terminal cleavage/methylation domain-containing protein